MPSSSRRRPSLSRCAASCEGTDLDAGQHPGVGVALWLHATDVQAIHDALVADGPFGRTFAFADPDGYRVTLHDRV